MLVHRHGTINQRLKLRGGDDACMQTRVHNPRMFETSLDTTRNTFQICFNNGLLIDACTRHVEMRGLKSTTLLSMPPCLCSNVEYA